MNNFESDLSLKIKNLEEENLLLKNIIKMQKCTLDQMIEHFITQDTEAPKDSNNKSEIS